LTHLEIESTFPQLFYIKKDLWTLAGRGKCEVPYFLPSSTMNASKSELPSDFCPANRLLSSRKSMASKIAACCASQLTKWKAKVPAISRPSRTFRVSYQTLYHYLKHTATIAKAV
jgi:hypothetical protein